jgi:regulator of protease activity HflC (stomatin/prohibitin superfamily)
METKERNFKGLKLNGILMLILNILLLLAIIAAFIWAINTAQSAAVIISLVVLFICNCIAWAGFIQIEPNEAVVLIFFGKYSGTIKDNGFFWVNPFFAKKKMTLRARNMDAEPIKVNDKKGNPILIGQVLVWRVVDTYKASFDIDNTTKTTINTTSIGATGLSKLLDSMKALESFTKVQSDAALRSVAGMFAYDNSENESEHLTLRSGGEEINDILEKQLNERLAIAGIEVVEARVNYLAYAPEIAAVMLRRQQAEAIISAREKIVDGAVGMVKHALEKLSQEKIIDLDDEKKAAMVSNLLVVLCSDEHAQPVLNTGTLYN